MRPDPLPVRRVTAPGEGTPPGATWSSCLVVGTAVHVSGITARGPGGVIRGGDSVDGQTRACIETLKARLEAAGGGLHNVVKLVIHLVDMEQKAGVNAARAALFGPVYPCSTLVGTPALAFPGLLVEVDAVADLAADLRTATDLS